MNAPIYRFIDTKTDKFRLLRFGIYNTSQLGRNFYNRLHIYHLIKMSSLRILLSELLSEQATEEIQILASRSSITQLLKLLHTFNVLLELLSFLLQPTKTNTSTPNQQHAKKRINLAGK